MNFNKPMVTSSIDGILKYTSTPIKHVFEIGAFDGVDIEHILNIFNECTVHTFEPDPECFQSLNQFKDNNRVVINNIALSNKIGTASFFKCLDPHLGEQQQQRDMWYKTAQSLRRNSTFHHQNRSLVEQEIIVNCNTIDNYCRSLNIVPDILLIDTQGSEYEILEGAINSLKDIKVILTEWSSKELYVGQKMFDDINQLLESNNFKLKEKINLWGDWHGDAIFVKEKCE